MSIKQLREYIELIVEKAVTPAEAKQQKLALYVGPQDRIMMYVLYDVNKLSNLLKKWNWSKDDDGVSEALWQRASSCVLGMMQVKAGTSRGWGASTVMAAAAEQGYGPLLYDIVMKKQKGLMSDRDEVSPDARKVWTYYNKNRSDVVAKPLDNIDNPKTPSPKDDAVLFSDSHGIVHPDVPMNNAYFIKGSGPAIAPLVNNHKSFMKSQQTQPRERAWKSSDFREIGHTFFYEKYN